MSRKQKPIKIVCDQFLKLHPLHGPSRVIQIDKTAAQLGVSKRRLYDIFTVFEAIQMAKCITINTCFWYGASQLNSCLQELKYEERRLEPAEAMEDEAQRPQAPRLIVRKLTREFLMLFLTQCPGTIISFDKAVKNLFKPIYKYRQRKLYNISNILISIGLIEKASSESSTLSKPEKGFRFVDSTANHRIITPPTTPQGRRWEALLHVASRELIRLLRAERIQQSYY